MFHHQNCPAMRDDHFQQRNSTSKGKKKTSQRSRFELPCMNHCPAPLNQLRLKIKPPAFLARATSSASSQPALCPSLATADQLVPLTLSISHLQTRRSIKNHDKKLQQPSNSFLFFSSLFKSSREKVINPGENINIPNCTVPIITSLLFSPPLP